jgi:hypothetical protein
MKTKNLLIDVVVFAAAGMLSGCAMAPLKGGHASTLNKPSGGIEQSVVQGDNPAQVSRQDQETVKTKSYTVPAGSRMVETHVVTDAGGAPVTNAQSLLISAPMAVTEHEETRAKTELGAAQKDTARELSAKLGRRRHVLVRPGLHVFSAAASHHRQCDDQHCHHRRRRGLDGVAVAGGRKRAVDIGWRRRGGGCMVFRTSARPVARAGGCGKSDRYCT